MLDWLRQQVLEMESRVADTSHHAARQTAIFDLDGTLLIGDVGEAVFAYLTLEHYDLKLAWTEYQQLLRTHKSKAYRAVVEAMAGLETETVLGATSAVMNSDHEYFQLGSDRVRKPEPRPFLPQFISWLQERQYDIFIISASNHISVQYVAQSWFQVPGSHAFGIQSRICEGRLTRALIAPIPVGSGKAELFKLVAGMSAPLITATDSPLDLPMLQLTHSKGISLWFGDDHSDYDVVTANVKTGHRFVLAGLNEEPQLDEY